jgi:putative transposase
MRKKRELIEGAAYHVTSRTNGKIRIFDERLSRKIMLLVLEDAKEKYGFKLHNFCIMPTHIHLLITPTNDASLSRIIQWIKTQFTKIWNGIHNSSNHLWGERFFSRVMKDSSEYLSAHDYIDQNPVKAGLADSPANWEASGAFYIAHDIGDLVDNLPFLRVSREDCHLFLDESRDG